MWRLIGGLRMPRRLFRFDKNTGKTEDRKVESYFENGHLADKFIRDTHEMLQAFINSFDSNRKTVELLNRKTVKP
jgi:hypothetical protein